MKQLETLDEVFEALGKNSGLEALTGSKPSTVSMWKAAGAFPSNTYVVITGALREKGCAAPDTLWNMKSREIVS